MKLCTFNRRQGENMEKTFRYCHIKDKMRRNKVDEITEGMRKPDRSLQENFIREGS